MKKIIISLTLDAYLIRDLDFIAQKESRSRSSMAELLIRAGIKEWEKTNKDTLPAYEEE